MIEAVAYKDLPSARFWLDLSPSLISTATEFGETPLHLAVERDDHEMVEFLISRGANVMADSRILGLPLNHAALRSDVHMVGILIAAGADVNGQSTIAPQDRWLGSPLHFAAIPARLETVKLLLDRGADPNIPSRRGFTPLIVVSEVANAPCKDVEAIIDLLIQHGADVNAVGKEKSALTFAGYIPDEQKRGRRIKFLVSRGAKDNQ